MLLYVVAIFLLIWGSIYLLTKGLLSLKLKLRLPLSKELPATSLPLTERGIYSLPKVLRPFEFITLPFINLNYFKKLQMQTEVLKVPLNLSILILQKIFLAIGAGILSFVLFSSLAYALIATLIGFIIPDLIMFNKVRAKKEEIDKVFPETVDLLDMCINAGADFLSAIKWVIDKGTINPFIEQLEIVLTETHIGKTRSDALNDMAKRLQLADISSFVRTVIQSERMGTSIEEAFRTLSEDTRDRRFQAGERYAIKASLKILFPLLFCILPAIMIVVAGPIIIRFTEGGLFPQAGF